MKNNEYMTTFTDKKAPHATHGEWAAFHAWRNSVQHGLDDLELTYEVGVNDLPDFLRALRDAGITSFVYTDRTTAWLEMLKEMQECGCRMGELCTLYHKDIWNVDIDTESGEIEKQYFPTPGMRIHLT